MPVPSYRRQALTRYVPERSRSCASCIVFFKIGLRTGEMSSFGEGKYPDENSFCDVYRRDCAMLPETTESTSGVSGGERDRQC